MTKNSCGVRPARSSYGVKHRIAPRRSTDRVPLKGSGRDA
jgi:hypothetical protein